jgi:hypothetical protein
MRQKNFAAVDGKGVKKQWELLMLAETVLYRQFN